MKPDEVRGEMSPGRIDAFPPLKIRKTPTVIGLFAVARNRGAPLREAGMREHQHRHSVRSENAMESVHGTLQIGRVHEHVIRNYQIELRVAEGAKLGAGIHAELNIGTPGMGN